MLILIKAKKYNVNFTGIVVEIDFAVGTGNMFVWCLNVWYYISHGRYRHCNLEYIFIGTNVYWSKFWFQNLGSHYIFKK